MRIENGKIYQDRMPLCEGTDVFEIVEKIPANYFVWNIGENMGTDEYIPLVHDLHPEDALYDTSVNITIKNPLIRETDVESITRKYSKVDYDHSRLNRQ